MRFAYDAAGRMKKRVRVLDGAATLVTSLVYDDTDRVTHVSEDARKKLQDKLKTFL
jgi:hypothetical protein